MTLQTGKLVKEICSIIDNPAVPNGAVIQLAPPKVPSRLDQVLTFQEVVSQLNPKLNACLYSANRTLIS